MASSLLEALQDAALPAVWNRGVKLSQDAEWILVSLTADELKLHCRVTGQSVAAKVTLWPKDQDWHCDCGDRNDPCAHTVGALLAHRAGRTKRSSSGPKPSATVLRYEFSERDGFLILERVLSTPKGTNKLTQSLTAYTGGLQSGRIAGPPPSFTKADFAVDHVLLSTHNANLLDPEANAKLWQRLCECENIFFRDKAVRLRKQPFGLKLELSDEKNGLRLQLKSTLTAKKRFANGFAFLGGELAIVQSPSLTRDEEAWVRGRDRLLSQDEAQLFLSEFFPVLREKLDCELKGDWELEAIPPRMVLHLQEDGPERLTVLPRLEYGSPTMAERRGLALQFFSGKTVPIRDKQAEERELSRFRQELSIPVDQVTVLERDAALQFLEKASAWETRGSAKKQFRQEGMLTAKLGWSEDLLNAHFQVGSKRGTKVGAQELLTAWRDGRHSLHLGDGAWAQIPKAWLERYGARLEALLNARTPKGELPRFHLPELADLCEAAENPVPPIANLVRHAIEKLDILPEPILPKDLPFPLRPYQLQGVAWLQMLREAGLGALLADDMGLGKTLQALCAIKGRTLIVAPTSVMYSWVEQIQRFRPDLKFALYHGAQRKWDSTVPIVISSYGIVRQEHARFMEEEWDTMVLDEAQTIKNPDSLGAQACHQLRGKWRLVLTGTPVENELKDLWSLFNFLHPGLLGTRAEFQELYTLERLPELRRRVRSFILRRKKEDVARDLPPRTEAVMYVELREEERAQYELLRQHTREEVLQALETSGNVFAALELLLRLRQTCCDLSLLPGAPPSERPSSKLELLRDKIKETVEAGHAALVFSQWTSLLDRIEPLLTQEGIAFTRLDGSTRDRAGVVANFQDPNGPPVMLISLKAGGTGLTLTRADHVFIVDPWWNPAVEDQAGARAHRIGQVRPVLQYRLVAKDTVEEQIVRLQEHKRQLAESLLDQNPAAILTKEDLRSLIS